ncbi:ABC transporter permease [Nocardioides sp. L-11A]|uniref:ABC transporter permease n=1 Tax=Nocardioides sp. L-11A TaxID=3043848 RepID=UPI00249BA661|nr:ABC transporter permease [Nocardioides sp. L-11A]
MSQTLIRSDRGVLPTGGSLRRSGQAARSAAIEVGSHLWLGVALLVLWEIVARLWATPFVPPISQILAHLRDNWFTGGVGTLFLDDVVREHLVASVGRFAEGWAISILLGVSLGMLLGMNRTAYALMAPIVRFGIAIPATALLPVAIMLFGIGNGMNITIVVLGTFWTILVNTMDSARSIDEGYLRSAKSLRMKRSSYFRRIVLPAASPGILAGLRVSLGIALILVVVSEMFAASEGIGAYVVLSSNQFRFLDTWSGVVMIACFGIVANLLFSLLEARLLRWVPTAREGTAL